MSIESHTVFAQSELTVKKVTSIIVWCHQKRCPNSDENISWIKILCI